MRNGFEAAARTACGEAAHRRRTRLRAAIADRSRAPVRGAVTALRARIDHHHLKPDL